MISICSVTYRSLPDTKRFIDSVFRHTAEPFELIMGVNGRVDSDLMNYLTLTESMSRGKMRLLVNPTNIGVRAFHQVLRMAQSDMVFRCDSDIEIREDHWTRKMVRHLEVAEQTLGGSVAAVGTANTGGYRIQRAPSVVETDMIMSNCMLMNRVGLSKLIVKLGNRVGDMQAHVDKRLTGGEFYPGEFEDLKATIEYARFHSPWWDPQFGGPNEALGYGSDDMWWSIMARWAGFKLVTSTTKVFHADASGRPGYESERHRLVARGFQYMRTSLSLMMDVWDTESWQELPNRLPVLVNYRNSGQLIGA